MTPEQKEAMKQFEQDKKEDRRNRIQIYENKFHAGIVFENFLSGQHVDGYWTSDGKKGLEAFIVGKNKIDNGVIKLI